VIDRSRLPKEFQRFPDEWEVLAFEEAIYDKTGGNHKIKQSDYETTGPLPVIDQGQSEIAGYVSDGELQCKETLPCILFGDHTKIWKFVEQPFALGADGVKVLEPIEGFDKRFIFHYLKQLRLPMKAGYSRHFKYVKQTYVPKPPLPEQKCISAVLDKADTIRSKRQEAVGLANQFLHSVFLDLFGDPVTNPKGWQVVDLAEHIVSATNGLSRRRKDTDNIGDLVLRLQDIRAGSLRLNDPNRIALDDGEKQRFQVSTDDLLFIRVNGNRDYVGRCAVFTGHSEPVFHNDHIIRISFDEAFDPHFLEFVFNTPAGKHLLSKQIKTSAGQHTISQEGIGKVRMIKPSKDVQDNFQAIRLAVKKSTESQSKALSEPIFESLSQRAFAGDL
jgi:type I restriction enzyme S subunit